MTHSDQKNMFDELDRQRQQQKRVDRIMFVVIPIAALLITTICANLNWQSTLGTFIVLNLAFYASCIKRANLYVCMALITAYCLVDIYLSFNGTLPLSAIGRQLGTMLTFTGILSISRPHIDRWFIRSAQI